MREKKKSEKPDYIKSLFSGIKNADKKTILYIMLIAGVMLISFSGCETEKKTAERKSADTVVLNENLEKRLETILSKIDGVGKCRVVITYETRGEVITAQNRTKHETGGEHSSLETEESVVILGSGADAHPIVVKEVMPKVRGVIVVADGGGVSKIQKSIISAVSAVTGAPVNSIGVYPAKIN